MSDTGDIFMEFMNKKLFKTLTYPSPIKWLSLSLAASQRHLLRVPIFKFFEYDTTDTLSFHCKKKILKI